MGGRGEKLWPSALSLTYPSPTLPLMFPPPNLCFPCGSAGKESACNVRDLGSIPGLGRSPGEGKGYPLQYSGLENSMDCVVHRVAKSWTWLSHLHNLFSQSEQCFHFPHFAFLLFFWGASPLLGKPDLSFPQRMKPVLLKWKLGVLSTGSPGKFYAFPVLIFTETLIRNVHTMTTLKACFEQRNPCFHCQKGRVWGSWHPKWGCWMHFPIEISFSLLVLQSYCGCFKWSTSQRSFHGLQWEPLTLVCEILTGQKYLSFFFLQVICHQTYRVQQVYELGDDLGSNSENKRQNLAFHKYLLYLRWCFPFDICVYWERRAHLLKTCW